MFQIQHYSILFVGIVFQSCSVLGFCGRNYLDQKKGKNCFLLKTYAFIALSVQGMETNIRFKDNMASTFLFPLVKQDCFVLTR